MLCNFWRILGTMRGTIFAFTNYSIVSHCHLFCGNITTFQSECFDFQELPFIWYFWKVLFGITMSQCELQLSCHLMCSCSNQGHCVKASYHHILLYLVHWDSSSSTIFRLQIFNVFCWQYNLEEVYDDTGCYEEISCAKAPLKWYGIKSKSDFIEVDCKPNEHFPGSKCH